MSSCRGLCRRRESPSLERHLLGLNRLRPEAWSRWRHDQRRKPEELRQPTKVGIPFELDRDMTVTPKNLFVLFAFSLFSSPSGCSENIHQEDYYLQFPEWKKGCELQKPATRDKIIAFVNPNPRGYYSYPIPINCIENDFAGEIASEDMDVISLSAELAKITSEAPVDCGRKYLMKQRLEDLERKAAQMSNYERPVLLAGEAAFLTGVLMMHCDPNDPIGASAAHFERAVDYGFDYSPSRLPE